ncbi:sugar ABC transporter ATPase [Microbacterium barkeri]|uniref:sugar ABC transporter ATPase n=1 Tax=Microbacterium barkeri TaxID=33917 RepID=UPI0024AE94F9|nr:sugar ABC transporter ATPase [Microbacterium barkeri]MDI6943627.1 sugar ABC transporter ATPase [Microbacterium barkeri]
MDAIDSRLTDDPDAIRPVRDAEATAYADPSADPAQAEWEQTEARDAGEGASEETATGRDPDEIPADDDEIPAADLPVSDVQPETQDEDPVVAELGEDGEGDLAPEDL